ncbi:MAG: nucleotidyl transferase AbiEii/AbiGii toxin family protein [Bacteroidales bacterium]|nr:nucleotidyl transferase AbiEii/AbiGii toxin family protein [Bacteroidales bacterium]
MSNSVFDRMMSQYTLNSANDRRNATYEVMQQIVLAGLYRGGFFEHAAFYGGTCLRMMHGVERYSEDMDFSLLKKDEGFSLELFFPAIIDECRLMGREMEITRKDRRTFGKVESAFLKDTTDVYNISFQTEKSVKIKIEVDTMPPLQFDTEQKLLLQPFSFMVRCFTLPCLFAGKMHALLFRQWENRVKGRDWYDFEWYVRTAVPLKFEHLQCRVREFNGMEIDIKQFQAMLIERLSQTDIQQVKADVAPFVQNPHELDIWSNEYFVQLAKMIHYI